MAEIDFLLMTCADKVSGGGDRWKLGFQTVKIQKEKWHGFDLCLHRIPEKWKQRPEKIRDYVEKQKLKGINMWTDSGLDSLLQEEQPLPSVFLADWLLENMPFRPVLIVTCNNACLPEKFRIADFLEKNYQERNGLYLVGDLEMDTFLAEQIYEETGLVVGSLCRIPKVDGRKCVIVELGNEKAEGLRKIPVGSLYLDLTSDREKQRYFAVKRQDISYISARNFLDTALKTRYNAF